MYGWLRFMVLNGLQAVSHLCSAGLDRNRSIIRTTA